MRIIKVIENTEFRTIECGDIDENDNCIIRVSDPKHGTVIYAAGMVEGDDDALVSLGAVDGSNEFRIAVHPEFLEFNQNWNLLMKRE